jgi:hypothetical protein
MNNIALSYFEGIFEKCAMYGIDPEWLVKNAIPLRSAAEVAMSRFPRRVSGMVTPLYSHAQVAAGGLNPHIRPRLEPMPVGPMNIEPDAQLRNLIEQRLRLSELRGEAPVRIAPPKFDNIGKLDVKSIISAPGTHARETPPVETAGVPAEPVPAAIPKAAPAAGGGFMEGVNRVLRPVGTLATLGTVGAGTVGTYKGLQGLEPFLQDYETM